MEQVAAFLFMLIAISDSLMKPHFSRNRVVLQLKFERRKIVVQTGTSGALKANAK